MKAMDLLGLVVGIVAAVVLLYLIGKSCIQVVHQNTVAVVTRWGKHYAVWTAGLHFKVPFADRIRRVFSSQRQTLELRVQGDSNGSLPVDVALEVEVRSTLDPQVVTMLAYETADPFRHLTAVAMAAARELLVGVSFEQAMTDNELNEKFRQALAEVADTCGYEIMSVWVVSIRPERSVHEAVLAGERARVTRQDETAQTEHDAAVQVARARAAADVASIEAGVERDRMSAQATRLAELIDMLRSKHFSDNVIDSVINASLHLQAVEAANGSNARVFLDSPVMDGSH
jgi:regulator of protease activity HflC (stomatin/prohibitin superfamily)